MALCRSVANLTKFGGKISSSWCQADLVEDSINRRMAPNPFSCRIRVYGRSLRIGVDNARMSFKCGMPISWTPTRLFGRDETRSQ